jgi:hypothetical protein
VNRYSDLCIHSPSRRPAPAIDLINATTEPTEGDQMHPADVDTAFRQAHSCAEAAARGQATSNA